MTYEDFPAIPRDEDGPVFREPWEAQAFAVAVSLMEAGHFTYAEWAEGLTQEINKAQQQGDPDLGDTYYEHWLNALEQVCRAKELVLSADIVERAEQWRRAYLNTPHGQPIELSAAFKSGERSDKY